MKDKHRRLARERFWTEYEKGEYECPDCGRTFEETQNPFEVHHKDGDAHNNSLDNLVGVCRACHNLREGKKPSKAEIKSLRDSLHEEKTDIGGSQKVGVETVTNSIFKGYAETANAAIAGLKREGYNPGFSIGEYDPVTYGALSRRDTVYYDLGRYAGATECLHGVEGRIQYECD